MEYHSANDNKINPMLNSANEIFLYLPLSLSAERSLDVFECRIVTLTEFVSTLENDESADVFIITTNIVFHVNV